MFPAFCYSISCKKNKQKTYLYTSYSISGERNTVMINFYDRMKYFGHGNIYYKGVPSDQLVLYISSSLHHGR